MRVLLFSIVIICIAGSRTQEIAIGTEYLRAHINDTFSSESIINAQDNIQLLPAGPIVDDSDAPPSTTDSTTAIDIASQVAADDKNPKPNDNASNKISDPAQVATISIDVNNILNLFKQQLQESEKRIISAIQQNNPSNSIISMKSYRTHER